MYIYLRVRDLREDRELTQTEVAQLLGTTQKQYSRWETGESEFPFHHLITLAKFYNVTLDYIAGITNVPRKLPKD